MGYGFPAFNTMEQGLAIMEATDACDALVNIWASRDARFYAGDIMLAKMVNSLTGMYPHIPIYMHQDHGNNEVTCSTAIRHGLFEGFATPVRRPRESACSEEASQQCHDCRRNRHACETNKPYGQSRRSAPKNPNAEIERYGVPSKTITAWEQFHKNCRSRSKRHREQGKHDELTSENC